MKISRDILLICLWLVIAMILLTQVSPGAVELTYAEY